MASYCGASHCCSHRVERARRSTKEAFVDDAFAPTPKSLFLDGRGWRADSTAHRSSSHAALTWLRPAHILFPDDKLRPQQLASGLSDLFGLIGLAEGSGAKDGFRVIDAHPSADDIRQQALGDCWMISALACLAERPELLKMLLPTQASPALLILPRPTPSLPFPCPPLSSPLASPPPSPCSSTLPAHAESQLRRGLPGSTLPRRRVDDGSHRRLPPLHANQPKCPPRRAFNNRPPWASTALDDI